VTPEGNRGGSSEGGCMRRIGPHLRGGAWEGARSPLDFLQAMTSGGEQLAESHQGGAWAGAREHWLSLSGS